MVENNHGSITDRTEMLLEGVHVRNVAKRTQDPANSWLDRSAVQHHGRAFGVADLGSERLEQSRLAHPGDPVQVDHSAGVDKLHQ